MFQPFYLPDSSVILHHILNYMHMRVHAVGTHKVFQYLFHEFHILNQIKVKVKIKVNADDEESQFHNFLSSRLALLANI